MNFLGLSSVWLLNVTRVSWPQRAGNSEKLKAGQGVRAKFLVSKRSARHAAASMITEGGP